MLIRSTLPICIALDMSFGRQKQSTPFHIGTTERN
jgi:hypothetical protein